MNKLISYTVQYVVIVIIALLIGLAMGIPFIAMTDGIRAALFGA